MFDAGCELGAKPAQTNREIGARVKEARENAGLSTAQAARLRGISEQILIALENGNHPVLALDIIAFSEMYEVGYDWLLGIFSESDLPDEMIEMVEKLPPIDRRKLLRALASYGSMF